MHRTPRPRFRAFDHCAGLLGGLALIVAATFLVAAPPAAARSKMASCRIVSQGAVKFSGRCRFVSGRGGSFSLRRARGRGPLYGSILSVSVAIVGRGVAEVRGLTRGGINSRWGRAVRSRRNRSCWVGRDFRVCAR
jgi:hypothetical protein